MNLDKKILSDITIFNKYAKYLPDKQRRETWDEIIDRYKNMMLNKYPLLTEEINRNIVLIKEKKVLPSMRALQFAGPAIEKTPSRIYNCCFLPVDSIYSFNEIMFLLLGGTGVGYSVQFSHINKLPEILKPIKNKRFLIGDSIEGWADAVKVLMKAYLSNGAKPTFDYSDIRSKGTRLITAGGKAPGPEPLKKCLFEIETILERKNNGEKLTSLEVHDIICHIADSVLAGGIRRAALICLFSADDEDMLSCKYGNWWEQNPQRGRANNSAVLLRHRVTKDFFMNLWKKVELSNSGEPGISWTNNKDWGFNPCVIGETEIITKNGYERIDSLVNKEIEIWNGFEWSVVTPKITGYNQHLLKITLSDGRELTCTDYHNWILAEGYSGKNKKIEAKDLKIGDKIIKYNFPILEQGDQSITLKHAYTQGFISAEGMDNYKFFWLYEPKYICKDRLDVKTEGQEFKNVNGVGRKAIYYNDVYEPKDFIPFDWSLSYKIEWLAGLFDGDATELIEGGLQLSSTNLIFLKGLQKLLSTLGVNSKICNGNDEDFKMLPDGKGNLKEYFCNTSYRICIGATQIQNLKKLALECNRLSFNKTPQRDASQFAKIVKIEDAGYANEVYCFNEPLRHYGVFNGILTGQCHEIALRPYQFCNLCEINVSDITSQEDLNKRAEVASFFGTLQAGFTDFHYLRAIWKKTTEKDALIGVGMTGIASMELFKYNIEEASKLVVETNIHYSKVIGINKAARTTTVKPSGSTSCVLGTSSGIHAWHNDYYIRRMQLNKSEALYVYLSIYHPELIKDHLLIPNSAVIEIPIKAPENSVLRTESALDLLERVKTISQKWIKPGHISGDNTHNVSATISINKNRMYEGLIINGGKSVDEWKVVGEWMWNNRDYYSGLSVLPFDGGSYTQAPFEDITKEEYEERIKLLSDIDLSKVVEMEDLTDLKGEIACGGIEGCELK